MPARLDNSPLHARSGAAQLEILWAPGQNGACRSARKEWRGGYIGSRLGRWAENTAKKAYWLLAALALGDDRVVTGRFHCGARGASKRLIAAASVLIAAASVLLAAAAPEAGQSGDSCAAAGSSPCVMELHGPHAPSMSPNCSAEPWSRYLKLTLPGRFADSNKDGWWETVVEIALDPAKECGCVKLRIHFEDPVRDWSVNVGDSPTNNGLGGDAGTTNYAAELQVHKGVLAVFTVASPNLGPIRMDTILQWTLPPLGGRHADLEICEQALVFDMPGAFAGNRPLHWKLQTPIFGLLYSFAPRPGLPGPEGAKKKDKGLYAGFNRVVYGADKATPNSPPRIGTGVRRVEITLSP